MPGEVQLRESLFGLQSPTNEQLFRDRCAELFYADDSKNWVDVYQPRITQAGPIDASAANPSSEVDDTRINRIGDDIEYLGRCAVTCYRESNVGNLRSRFEQISRDWDSSSVSNLPKRPLFYIVRQLHSWSRLLTSHTLLEFVLSQFHPRVNDFILSFGYKPAETDIGGPRLWFYPANFNNAEQSVEHTEHYDCAYTLKYVERSRRDNPTRPWAERQTTIVTHRSELGRWVLVSPSVAMQEYLDRYMRALNEDETENTFAIHLLFIEAAMINWQPYMAYLTEETNDGANRAIVTSFDDDDSNIKTLFLEDRQKLQTIQDRITDMFAMLDSTLDVAISLEEKYYTFHLGLDAITTSRIHSDPIAFAFHEKIQELKFIRQKLESLHRRMKAIVQLASSALDLENGHSLRALAEEARREGKVMHALTEKATQDAAAVKVITVITMIYLPLTVVANFFSTVFVKQNSDGAATKVEVADNWWVLAAVGFPLTVVTFFMWWAISQRMLLVDAIQELRTRSTERLKALTLKKSPKKSGLDQESLAGSVVASGGGIA